LIGKQKTSEPQAGGQAGMAQTHSVEGIQTGGLAMRHDEQIRRNRDGSINIGFYARRAVADRTALRRAFSSNLRRALASAIRRMTKSIARHAE
jgi:hypothetical protein